MNWEAIGAIGEIVGATAVFVTLVYLAVQIRQNTKAQRNRARLEAMHGMTDWFSTVMLRPDLQEIWWRAVVSGDSLTEQERRNLRWMLSAVTAR